MPGQMRSVYIAHERDIELWDKLTNKSAFVQNALKQLHKKIDNGEIRDFESERLKGEQWHAGQTQDV